MVFNVLIKKSAEFSGEICRILMNLSRNFVSEVLFTMSFVSKIITEQ